MTEEEIKRFIDENDWTYAKSMPRTPHEYCLKKRCNDHEAFEKFVMFIRENGYKKRFWKKTFIYFDVGGHQYWTMGAPLEDTIGSITGLLKKLKRS